MQTLQAGIVTCSTVDLIYAERNWLVLYDHSCHWPYKLCVSFLLLNPLLLSLAQFLYVKHLLWWVTSGQKVQSDWFLPVSMPWVCLYHMLWCFDGSEGTVQRFPWNMRVRYKVHPPVNWPWITATKVLTSSKCTVLTSIRNQSAYPAQSLYLFWSNPSRRSFTVMLRSLTQCLWCSSFTSLNLCNALNCFTQSKHPCSYGDQSCFTAGFSQIMALHLYFVSTCSDYNPWLWWLVLWQKTNGRVDPMDHKTGFLS